jgi:DNA-binding phage protein
MSRRKGRRAKCLLDEKDVLQLLNEVIDRAGGQSAWAKRTGVDRVGLNKVLRGRRPLNSKILQALKLKKVYMAERPL